MSWIENSEASSIYDLSVDQSYYNVTSRYLQPIYLYSLSADCVKCPYTRLHRINHNSAFTVNSASDYSFRLFEDDQGVYSNVSSTDYLCHLNRTSGEFGAYNILVNDHGRCSVETIYEPVNIYFPLILFAFILICLVGALKGWRVAYAKYRARRQQGDSAADAPSSTASLRRDHNPDNEMETPPKVIKRARLKSLDCFRGIAIVLMIFCNSGAGHYDFLEHKVWNGLNLADFIFPSFLWIMGVCVPMAMKSQMTRGVPKSKMLGTILRRSITLFLIGVCLNSIHGPTLSNLRIFGVLQRFGVAYLVVSSVFVLFVRPPGVPPQNPVTRSLYDIILLLPQWLIMLGVVAIYLAVTFLLPVPGCPTGYLGPGGMHENGRFNACIGGSTGYIDLVVLGSSHIYQNPTAKHVYHSQAFDPEGVFGCLMTIFQVFLGVQSGMVLLLHVEWKARVKRWLLWAIAFAVIGGALCGFSQEDGWIPVNKNMWSLSFVLVTTAVATLVFTLCFLLVDVKRWWTGCPFVYCGMNAIFMYIGHTVLNKILPFHWKLNQMNTHFMLLLESGWNTLLWVGVAYYMFRRKTFITV